MTFDTKIAIIIRDDLEMWQRLNVTAYIASALVAQYPDISGEKYEDGSGNLYMPMVIQPMLVFQADANGIQRSYRRAMDREVRLALFTKELFSTGNDIDNRAAVKAKLADELDLVGIAMREDKKTVDKIVKGLKLHP